MIDNRKKALLHIVPVQLGWDDDTYRGALQAHAGVSSAGDLKLSQAGFKRFMAHAEKCGFKSNSKKSRKPPASKALLTGKVKAMCVAMDLTMKYADGIAKRMFGIDRIGWCSADQLRKIVAALMYKKQKD
jgi:phage gp16-like protein